MPSRSPMIESLESRRLLAAGVHVAGHTLAVTGSLFRSTTIIINKNADTTHLDVSLVWISINGKHRSVTRSIAIAGLTDVFVHGGFFNDTITIGTSGLLPFTLPATVRGAWGSDTINTGAENDTIDGA